MKERGKKNILILYKSGIERFLELVILLNSCVHYTHTVSKIFLISAHKNRACYGCNSILYVHVSEPDICKQRPDINHCIRSSSDKNVDYFWDSVGRGRGAISL